MLAGLARVVYLAANTVFWLIWDFKNEMNLSEGNFSGLIFLAV